ncbi:hypothetical protein WA026_005949 [Henosepilachna vigintioctopunctata]|uniref:WD repeat-containing protein 75 second beta-propeller domain-containing protein n=1 Tax=Henosepilachna vigintioctopunctata TaxID=420089 RepID=A0AAW1U2G4_9CUCU
MTEEKVELICRGGGDFSLLKSQFSTCEESVYVARKGNILQYSVKTGLLLFKYPDQENSIVGFGITNINSSEVLISCCQNGDIAIWKTVTHFKIMTKKISCSSIKSFHCFPAKHDDSITDAVITFSYLNRTIVALVDILKEKFRKYDLKLKGNEVFIGVSPRRFFAVADKKRIHFVSIDNKEKSNTVSLRGKRSHQKHLTCLECHSEEEIVITGDSEGKVTLWHNIFNVNPAQSVYHWHTLPVNCLAFSATGSYFYSGGEENVLVRWDWENTQDKKFLPRMSGNIKQISLSPHSQFIGVSTSDNAVRIIDAAFNDVSLIQELVVGDNYECGIALDPRTKALVMNGSLGQIQFYQANTSTLLYSMEVVGQNKLTNERNCLVENTRVTKFAISKSGLWLVTVEERRNSQFVDHEMRLKFWSFDVSSQKFELNTSIEKPHEDSITSVAFQTSKSDDNLRCATVGKDKKFKVWHRTVIQQTNIDRTIWNCLSVGFYRNLPCKGLSFSSDGSLMGIGFGCLVTTWTPDSCDLKCSLVYPGHKTNIEELQFGTHNQCHLVVAATKERLSVWNLLTLTMIWTVPLEVEFLLADKMSIYMAVITKNSEIFFFSPNSPNPVYSSVEIIASHKVMAAAFIPGRLCQDLKSEWYERVEFYLIDSNKELFSIGVKHSEEYPTEYLEENIDGTSLSLYSKMMPYQKISNVVTENRKHLFEKESSHKNIQKYLDAPVHTMLPIRLNCRDLIKSLIIQKNSKDFLESI